MTTNNPLIIWVDYTWGDRPEVAELVKQGHTVAVRATEHMPDLILSTKAWNWNDSMWPYLEIALKSARKDKPKGIKKDGKQRKTSDRADRHGTGKVSRRGRKVKSNNASILQTTSSEA